MEPITATKLTIYIGDSDKHGHKPLHLAIIELLHAEGFQGRRCCTASKALDRTSKYTPPESWTSVGTCPRSS